MLPPWASSTPLRIARGFVLFVHWPGGQHQFSTALAFQAGSRVPLRELPIYALEHLADPLTAESLARRVAMSVRNLPRVFREEYGCPPAVFVGRLQAWMAHSRQRPSILRGHFFLRREPSSSRIGTVGSERVIGG